ncbi:hypothetical protein SAMN04487917_11393 [Arthrobacter sp. yr096]|uniref:hypothetical protein n=1 Tax=Arthrobacter sp. yr096 TaxID=1761750 RepID=UPI0008D486E0|nr:hypothetical protein [Arthrobacter sp. yr096]SEJ78663.1 hypothetical protein SAMN04487917_11393 [Arthrobacter sp. yr096]
MMENQELLSDGWGQPVPWEWVEHGTPEYRSSFTAAALDAADRLRRAAPSFGEKDFVLTDELPLPRWFSEALSEAPILGVEGSWPQFGRTSHPVNWPELIREHPTEVRYMADEMTSPPALFDELWTWAASQGLKPSFDVDLYIEPDGLIGVWGFEFSTNKELSPAQIAEAATIMAKHGHEPAEHEPNIEARSGEEGDKRASWMLYV